jgi:hypothetical protein
MMKISDTTRLDFIFKCTDESCDCDKDFEYKVEPNQLALDGTPICENGYETELQHANLAPIRDVKAKGVHHLYAFEVNDDDMASEAGEAVYEDMTNEHNAVAGFIQIHAIYDESERNVPDFLTENKREAEEEEEIS